MAAYAALVTLSKAIHQILPYEQHYSFLCPKHQMQSLLDKVIRLQEFLEDVSGKSSDGVDELESRIRDFAQRLEDIVESILVHSLAMEYENEVNSRLSIQDANSELISSIGKTNLEASFGEASSHLSFQEANTELPLAAEGRAISFFRELFNKLCVTCFACTGTDTEVVLDHTGGPSNSGESKTEASLDDILGWCLDQDLENKAKYSHLPLIEHAAAAFGNSIEEADLLFEKAIMEMKKILNNRVVISTTSLFSHNIAQPILSGGQPDTNNTTVGLKGVLDQILNQITSRQSALEVIPITGMGGIGKTTLARAVYDHHGKKDRFDLVLWATVSQHYNVIEILRSLLSVDAEKREPNKTLIQLVHQRLYSRRYLIILDDVWDEKVWDGVRNAFPNNNNCSRVILTTRLSKIATYVSSSSTHAHQMQLLNEEQSWDLLRETVYGHEAGSPCEFEDIGKKVSRRCKGLPLALVVIGGLLKFNNTRDYWLKVAESTTTKAAGNDNSLLGILSLSYKNLPPHLKACFLYFGRFPEDKEIPTKELVRLWCAEGFLEPRESKTLEEVAEECLEELVERNLVLVMKKRYNGKIKRSSIHDVLRDLSLSQAQTEKFLYCHHGRSWIDKPRRVSFPGFNLESSISYISPIRTLRTDRWCVIPQLKLLRVLGTLEFSSANLTNSVRMNNLRYLHLDASYGRESSLMVPKSISKLRNLETLFVSSETPLYYEYDLILPVEIWEMPRLRHLVVSDEVNMKLPPFPASDGSSIESSSLQTLTGLSNFYDFTPSVIHKLQQNLKKLQIKYKKISNGDRFKEFGVENLANLHHLENLTISRHHFDGPILTNIGFPTNLKKLSLRDTRLTWEKMTWIGDSLKHLEVLKLSLDAFVGGKVWEPIEGGFPQLKYLKMNLLDELEEWKAKSKHFPSLEKLVILQCISLKEVPAEIGDIDTLEKLIVKKYKDDDMGRGFEESVRRIEEEQKSFCNHSLQVIIMSRGQKLSDVDR